MTMTAFGYAFVPLLLLCVAFARGWLPALLVFATVFQGAAVIVLPLQEGGFGVTPWQATALACAGVLAMRVLRSGARLGALAAPGAERLLLAYSLIAITGALILPHLFAGLQVFSPMDRAGFDGPLRPLEFSRSNLMQAANVLVTLAMLLFFIDARRREDWRPLRLVYALVAGAMVVVLAGGYERLALLNTWPSIHPYWLSNPTYVQIPASNSAGLSGFGVPFSEPSYASAFLASLLIGLFSVAGFGKRFWLPLTGCVLLGATLLNTLGSTGWVAAAAGAGAILLLLTLMALGRRGDPRRPARRAAVLWAAALLALAGGYWVTYHSSYAEPMQRAVSVTIVDKAVSASYQNRTTANEAAVRLLRESYGLGVGIGSHRASSFVASLAGGTGIAGLVAFFCALAAILIRYVRVPPLGDSQRFAACALLGATLAVAIGIPDLHVPFYWAFVLVALVMAPRAPPAPPAE